MIKRHIIPFLILVILSWWAIRPLFVSGFFPMHDDTQVGRVVAMGKALRNVQFPVRWVSDLGYGYGYPIFNFYGPLPYYIGGFFYAIGFWGLTATKIMFGLGILLAPVAMYVSTVMFFGRLGAVLSAILYLYAPYHAVQIYVRGAVGEFWALVFLPLIFLGIWSKSIVFGAIGLAGLVLSHTLLGFVATVLLIAGLVLKKYPASLLVLGLGLSAFFWLPALVEMGYTSVRAQIGPSANVLDHFVCMQQLWNSPWGFGGSAPGCIDGLSFKLGKAHVVFALFSLALLFAKKLRQNAHVLVSGLLVIGVSIFLLLKISEIFWKFIPGFLYIQYPWRFLSFASFGLSVLGGAVLLVARRIPMRLVLFTLMVGVVLVLEAKWFTPQFTFKKEQQEFETREELRWRVSKISDEYLPSAIVRPKAISELPGSVITPTGSLEVGFDIDRETYKKFAILSKHKQTITLARVYFPGWRYWVNGKEAPIVLDRGLPILEIPEGESVVEMRFTNTPIRSLANMLTLITIFYLIYTYGKKTHT